MIASEPSDRQVLVLAPVGRDAELAGRALAAAGIEPRVCPDPEALVACLQAGAGAAVLTEEALTLALVARLAEQFEHQPQWSDLPLVLLLSREHLSSRAGGLDPLGRRPNLVLLERPTSGRVLVAAVKAAIAARQRQYQVRDLLVQLQQLALELHQAEHRERRRLAELLHDHLQQLLVAARFHLGRLRARVDDPAIGITVDSVDQLLDESISVSRSLTMELSPPVLHELGLGAGLHWLGRWMQEKHGLCTHVHVEDSEGPQSEGLRVLLFQAARELLFNVVKHAGVQEAWLEMTRTADGCFHLMVADEGAGFNGQANHKGGSASFGLFSLRQRLIAVGGEVEIDSRPGQGTRIRLTVPPLCDDASEPV